MGAWETAKWVMTFMAEVTVVLGFLATVVVVVLLLASGEEYDRLRREERCGRVRALRLAFKACFKRKNKGQETGTGTETG
ncbi:hypothetical protein FQN51_007140 [Onygenales sp. PD_10]|nr:hypothetical protein FQN51_007140 [Onygenales sp. PD_10]